MNARLTSSFRIFCLLLAALLVGFHFPWLVGQQSYYQSDLTYYFQPFSDFIAAGYRGGRLPLWNPYLYCGMAQAAVPSPGMFYPPMLIFAGLPFSQALAVYLVFHQLIAGAGAYLLVASMGWGVLAAAVCGFAVALGGYMFALTANYTLVATIAWLPLLLFFVRAIDNTMTRSNIVHMFGAAFCMFCMVGAGRPELFVPAALLVSVYIVVTAYGAYRQDAMPKQAVTQAGLRVISLGAGCLLALPIILPAVEWVRLSPRSKGLELRWVLMWSANWYDVLNMIAAQPLGDLTLLGTKYLNLVAARANSLPYVTSSFVGPVVTTLAVWSLFDRTWRWRFVMLAVFFAGIIMALGEYTPIAPFICKLSPAFSAFRYPVKLMIFPALVLCFMAARGASMAIEKEVKPSAQITSAAVWGLMLLVGIIFLLTPQLHLLTAKFPWLVGKTVNFEVMRESQALFGKSLAVTGGLGLLMNANYIAYIREQLTKELFAFLTGGTLLLTLFMPAMAYQRHGAEGDFYNRKHKLVAKLQQAVKGNGQERFAARVQPLYHDPLTPGFTFYQQERTDNEHGFYLFTRELVLPNTNVDFQIPYAFGYEAAEEGFYKTLYSDALSTCSQNLKRPEAIPVNDAPMARFCQITSVNRVLTQAYHQDRSHAALPMDASVFELEEENLGSNYRVWKTRDYLPRAYFATRILWNATQPDFRKAVLTARNSELLRNTFVFGAAPSGLRSGIDDGAAASSDKIEFLEDGDQRVRLRTTSTAARLAVLTDRLYPGWTATVDGKPAPILLVNAFARGVAVPPGTHEIAYTYAPMSVWAGGYAAGAVLLLFLLAFLFSRRR